MGIAMSEFNRGIKFGGGFAIGWYFTKYGIPCLLAFAVGLFISEYGAFARLEASNMTGAVLGTDASSSNAQAKRLFIEYFVQKYAIRCAFVVTVYLCCLLPRFIERNRDNHDEVLGLIIALILFEIFLWAAALGVTYLL